MRNAAIVNTILTLGLVPAYFLVTWASIQLGWIAFHLSTLVP